MVDFLPGEVKIAAATPPPPPPPELGNDDPKAFPSHLPAPCSADSPPVAAAVDAPGMVPVLLLSLPTPTLPAAVARSLRLRWGAAAAAGASGLSIAAPPASAAGALGVPDCAAAAAAAAGAPEEESAAAAAAAGG